MHIYRIFEIMSNLIKNKKLYRRVEIYAGKWSRGREATCTWESSELENPRSEDLRRLRAGGDFGWGRCVYFKQRFLTSFCNPLSAGVKNVLLPIKLKLSSVPLLIVYDTRLIVVESILSKMYFINRLYIYIFLFYIWHYFLFQ